MEQLAIYHQYSAPAIFQAVTHILKKWITIVFREKGNLSAPQHLTCFLNIETWKHSPIVLIPIFLAPPYVPTKLKLFTSYSLATRSKHEEPKRPTPLHQQTSLWIPAPWQISFRYPSRTSSGDSSSSSGALCLDRSRCRYIRLRSLASDADLPLPAF